MTHPRRLSRTRRILIRHGLAHEIALAALALPWVVLGLALRDADDAQTRAILSLSGAIGLLFVADWAVRARASGAPGVYARHHWLVPALALAGVLPVEPVVQLARFALAFVGLRRILGRMGGMFARFRRLDELVALSLAVWAAGGVLLYELEVGANEKMTSVGDGLWWSLVTVSTVGYGDIAPVTSAGRLAAAVLITIGVGLFAAAVAIIGRYLADERTDERDARARLRQIAELERRHAAREIKAAEFAARVRALTGSPDEE